MGQEREDGAGATFAQCGGAGAAGIKRGNVETKIIIATHKPYWVPDEPVYQPVQVGHALHPDIG